MERADLGITASDVSGRLHWITLPLAFPPTVAHFFTASQIPVVAVPKTAMGDSGEQKEAKEVTNPDELSTLLDNALADFGKQRNTDDDIDALMNDFDQQAAKKAAADFQKMLTEMIEVQQESSKKAAEGAAPEESEEMRSLTEAMSKMAETSGNLANAPDDKSFLEALMKMEGGDSPMEPFMSMMMQAFMAKDVMYPPLKELADGFPGYLEEHKDSLDAETLEKYEKQQEVVGRICAEYETDVDEANQAANHERFERLGKLLVELQTYGYPPQELAGSLPPGWSLDGEGGVPKLEDPSKAAESCVLM
uniref:Peroxin-19 n=1 Tax=Steinernema glaseri TaxID=37863 RepID=A0A1I7Z640_9BILA